MRFVPIKNPEEQAQALAFKTRALIVAQRTALMNALRAHLAEFGIVAPKGPAGSGALIKVVRGDDQRLPSMARQALLELADLLDATEAKVAVLDQKLSAAVSDDARRLMEIPGVGTVTAGTITALAGDVSRFRKGRDFAAWLGLTPRQNSSGDKVRIGRISKAGNRELRTLLVLGQMAVMRHARAHPEKASRWLTALIARRPPLVVAVALAAKTARIIWAMLSRSEKYRPTAA
jgi:transposase